MMQRAKGFTLIELIIVIVLLSIVAIFSFRFVGLGSEMFVTGADRVKLLDQSRFTIERVTRELRNSVPNSARVLTSSDNSFQCLEFVPIKTAGTYYGAPFSSGANGQFEFVSLATEWVDITPADRLFVYATRPFYIYDDVASQRWAGVATSTLRAGDTTAITLQSGQYFQEQSPRQRMYVGAPPVSFCVDSGGQLIRYRDYGWNETQVRPPASAGTVIGERLVNLQFSGTQLPFRVDDATLLRNNVIHVFLEYRSASAEALFFNQEIQVPNAP
ncbi:PilW family protein [Idiomarina sp. OT37-5b]|uniref:PilW family protein n=1 Tax=Idiomarina sp. OT37-5b TaxID=2100422 RepID=UPI0021CB4A51|nr:type II secretion system protein [Idiomarina sp. OT37-5b]